MCVHCRITRKTGPPHLPASFGKRVEQGFAKYGNLCVGIDPHSALLEEWNLPDDHRGLHDFAMRIIDAAAENVAAIKPQVAFFERHGSKGFEVLEKLVERIAQTDLLLIMDAKRGDIGTTMDGYFDAWLSKNAPFVCDALTVSPYLGFDSLTEVMSNCTELGRGLFVLAATSNPEGAAVQLSQTEKSKTLAADIWSRLEQVNQLTSISGDSIGSFGAVVGATLKLGLFGLNSIKDVSQEVATPILAPGFGAQGAELSDAVRLFGVSSNQVLYSVSRSVLASGPSQIASAIAHSKSELAAGLRDS